MSSEQALNQKKSSSKKTKKSYNKEKKSKQAKVEQQSQIKKKFPDPIIYDPDSNQRNIPLATADDTIFKDKGQTARVAMKITNNYLELHKDMINTYNLVYFQILQNILNLSWNGITIPVRFMNSSIDVNKNIYTSSSDATEESKQLLDNIINKNLDTFIKSIELSHKFYKDVIESYLNCIKKL
ncbi:MAG TPA: hypothetical protein VJ767_11410 [Nitrososphaeraceae archaeon]|nr:hypothetical protein [Nitrososphaeraceae archaeon]